MAPQDIFTSQKMKFSIKDFFSKWTFKKYVRWGEGGGGHWKASKNEQGEGGGSYHLCTFTFLKKDTEIFKMKFYSYSTVFHIDFTGSMK